MKKFVVVLSLLVLALGATPLAFAQEGVESLCLVIFYLSLASLVHVKTISW